MQLELLRILQVQRDLYAMPRDMKRFRRYVETMTGGGSDMILPIGNMNPMGKDHVPAMIDRYLALKAEDEAEAALVEARRRLSHVGLSLRVALVATDDLHGGWTDRDLTDAAHRFAPAAKLKRGFATAPLWTGEAPDVRWAREGVLEDVYRLAHVAKHGVPKTLAERMRQEGRALRFSLGEGSQGNGGETVDGDAARKVISPHLASVHYPTVFACLYGDVAAVKCGYPPLGLGPRAGFAVALADAMDEAAPETYV